MHKKYYAIIILAHLIVPISLLFPILRVNEIRLGLSGGTTTSEHYMNIIEYIASDIYTITGILILFLALIQLAGVGIAVVGLVEKSVRSILVRLSFISSFSCAILAALQIYSGSRILFIICAVSFVTIAFSSIRLMKIEEKSDQS
ncbi:MAG: hypothetical protein IJ437_00235 [Clostridia bacterium]|nr:hypothetical protein [Clostridia bacterium]